ncbi:16S rRNA (guanine(966)-N(2))-methyltransferase RsmD [Candidatus Thiosymbion oneisti]|uniref:16S rRNA (guanine(966)-N(2))-methyltransferase RsmD n=1 Tax=Candidatus Thiosymbion oneisti TaxID=589554 RepID=UPI000AED4D31|nr:16S rRNA (guanine(966)-N(2))-methyltransferase RsmD [Candidatus Thiosymbion oneisti]
MRAGNKGQLRIIGGRYRGRRLSIPAQPGLRPTADRVRETLFNWLQPVILGSRCLDLFAGSGALGFEAASRGADEVLMIDCSEPVTQVLAASARSLGAAQVRVRRADALRWLAGSGGPFDLVFLDPPFHKDLLAPSCTLLSSRGWLAPGALVYLEVPANRAVLSLPPDWTLIRDKRAGQVRFALAAVEPQKCNGPEG